LLKTGVTSTPVVSIVLAVKRGLPLGLYADAG